MPIRVMSELREDLIAAASVVVWTADRRPAWPVGLAWLPAVPGKSDGG